MKRTICVITLICIMVCNITGCGMNLHTSSNMQITSSDIEQPKNSSEKEEVESTKSEVATSNTSKKQSISILPKKTKDLTKDIETTKIDKVKIDQKFVVASYSSAIGLFKESLDKGKNTLISPLSMQLSLALATNGAKGETKTEMEKVLGGLSIEDLNGYYSTYLKSIKNDDFCKLNIANSIWVNDEFSAKKTFLKTAKNNYSAQIFNAPFNKSTVKDVNKWVKKNTDKMIEEMIDNIDKDAMLFIINAIVFDAKWDITFNGYSTKHGKFTNYKGKKQTVEMMNSTEYIYLQDGEDAEGFVKDYSGEKYSFAALLPNEDIDFYEYINSLNAEKLYEIIKNVRGQEVDIKMPKFNYDYSYDMKNALKSFGIKEAFKPSANFTKLSTEPVFISEVLHKTVINVDEGGTRAAAASNVTVGKAASMPPEKQVILNRPFIYMIIDNTTKIPIFIGTVVDL